MADDGSADGDRSRPCVSARIATSIRAALSYPTAASSRRCVPARPDAVLWTEIFTSEDGGRTWRFLSRVNDWERLATLRMRDGRIVCVYGYRIAPFGVRARVSDDDGRTWSRVVCCATTAEAGTRIPARDRARAGEAPGRLLHELPRRSDPDERRRASHRADDLHARVGTARGLARLSIYHDG